MDWRSWSAADRVSAGYVLLRQTLTGDDLRVLYEVTGDKEALAAMDRETMRQPAQVAVADIGVRR